MALIAAMAICLGPAEGHAAAESGQQSGAATDEGARPAGTAASGAAAPAVAVGRPPARVVSINLCTDQLALLLAAPGQLLSVSWLSQDPQSSMLAAAAARLPANHARAEEIAMLRPDLVLAGAYSAQATVALLRRIGIPVEVFPPETDLDGIRANLRRMGGVLGRAAAADAALARFDADLAALTPPPGPRPRAALYSANGYSSGDASLSGAILRAAGYANIGEEMGLGPGGVMALERLVLAAPDLVVRSRHLPGHSRSEEVLDHPALAAVIARTPAAPLSDPDWVCGTPQVTDVIARLRAARPGGGS